MKNFLKKISIVYLSFFIILAIFTIVYSLLIYYGKVSSNMKSFNNITFILGLIAFLFLGVISGMVAKKNGLLEGLISALIIIIIVLLINLFVQVDFNFNTFIKCVAYLTAASLGGIIGVNLTSIRKKNLQ